MPVQQPSGGPGVLPGWTKEHHDRILITGLGEGQNLVEGDLRHVAKGPTLRPALPLLLHLLIRHLRPVRVDYAGHFDDTITDILEVVRHSHHLSKK